MPPLGICQRRSFRDTCRASGRCRRRGGRLPAGCGTGRRIPTSLSDDGPAMRAVSGHEPTPPVRRDVGGAATGDALLRDTRHAVRRLARDWRFTAAAVLILGLGIGANTAIFSLINATLFRQQSFADPDRLVDIYQNASNAGGLDGNSYPAYLDMAAYTDVFASTTAASVPLRRELPGRGRAAAGGRRTHHGDVPVRAGTPAVARALVRRGGGHARRRGGGRRRARRLDEEVPRGSVRDRPHHPDRGCAGHDRRRWPGRSPRHDQHRHRHRLLAADLVAPGARRAAAHAGAASGRGGLLREGSAPGWRHRRAGAGRDGHPGHAGWQPSTRRRIRARALRCSRRATCAFTRRWTVCCAPSRRCCSSSSGSCWRSRAATWRRCCSCAGPPARRRCRFGWPWARRADSSFVTC